MKLKILILIIIGVFITGCTSSDQAFMQDWMEATVDELNK